MYMYVQISGGVLASSHRTSRITRRVGVVVVCLRAGAAPIGARTRVARAASSPQVVAVQLPGRLGRHEEDASEYSIKTEARAVSSRLVSSRLVSSRLVARPPQCQCFGAIDRAVARRETDRVKKQNQRRGAGPASRRGWTPASIRL